jgi:hypothetical protein
MAKSKLNIKKIHPIPEILDGDLGKDWTIVNTDAQHASVDIERKVLKTPLDDSEFAERFRIEQIARLEWSQYPAGVLDDKILHAVETRRITMLLRQAGVDVSTPLQAAYVSPTVEQYMLNALETHGSGDYASVKNGILDVSRKKQEAVDKDIQEVVKQLAENPTPDECVRLAEILRKKYILQGGQKSQRPGQGNGKGKPQNAPGGMPGNSKNTGEHNAESYEELLQMMEQEIPPDSKVNDLPPELARMLPDEEVALEGSRFGARVNQLRGGGRCYPKRQVDWTPMEIQYPALAHKCQSKFAKRWKPAEEGVVPRYPHRYFIDKQVFAYKRKIPGGTVIIDGSGSMCISSEQIDTIVKYAPGCLVAIYGGHGSHGTLKILAKNGKRVSPRLCTTPGGQNNIDGPAIRWALKHSHPRIWITDGGITGRNDAQCSTLFIECAAIVRKGRFFVKRNAQEGIALLKKFSKYYKW